MSIFINRLKVEWFKFPAGEIQVKVNESALGENNAAIIDAYLYTIDDIMCLLQTVDAIRNIDGDQYRKIYLNIPYFPYARQDRACNKTESFSLKIMCDLLKTMNVFKISTYDIHSNITKKLLYNYDFQSVEVSDLIENKKKFNIVKLIKNNNMVICSPDKGAEKRVSLISDRNPHINFDLIFLEKIRDVLTGDIVSISFKENLDKDKILGRNILVIDDICDGGRTFIKSSLFLKKNGAKNVSLFVTHGIFSHGFEELKQHIKHIYCYHTFLKKSEADVNYLTILNHYRDGEK